MELDGCIVRMPPEGDGAEESLWELPEDSADEDWPGLPEAERPVATGPTPSELAKGQSEEPSPSGEEPFEFSPSSSSRHSVDPLLTCTGSETAEAPALSVT